MGACGTLFIRVACVGNTGVCKIVVSVGVSVGGIGIYIVVSRFVSIPGVDVFELWSCAIGGLIWVAGAAGRLAIFGDMGMSGFGVIGDNAASTDGVVAL